jgi:dipeptidyl aminopeptidase/acylaminoacyl peptidase
MRSGTAVFFIVLSLLDAASAFAEQRPEYTRGEKLPLAFFAALPDTSDVALSPDGENLAAVHNVAGDTILIVRKASEKQHQAIAKFDNRKASVNWIRWANDRRVLISLQLGVLRQGMSTLETRLLSVERDGSDIQTLFEPGRRRASIQFQDHLVDLLPDDRDHVMMAFDVNGTGKSALYRVNVNTGNRSRVSPPLTGITNWLTDRQHRPRITVRQRGLNHEVLIRGTDQKRFRTLWRYERFSGDEIIPLGFAMNPDHLYVQRYHQGYMAVFLVDLNAPDRETTPVWQLTGRDVDARMLFSTAHGETIGLNSRDGQLRLCRDRDRILENAIADAFPSEAIQLLDTSRDGNRFLLLATGAVNPGTYYLVDRHRLADSGRDSFDPVASRYPHLPATLLAGGRRVSVTSRDGQSLDAVLTLPPSGDNGIRPAVVLVHGGPLSHDRLPFDAWREFLANRGYAVLQVNFRGSTGYGIDFLRAGLANWGRSMQDDLSDAAQWLINEDIADSARICIVGSSYGGYAALMATIRTDDMFRCAISFAGVTDLKSMLKHSRRYRNAEVAEAIIGTSKRDLVARSPARRAQQIHTPVLIIHGSADRVVPVEQSRMMHKALTAAGKSHRYVEQPGGDHYLNQHPQRIELFEQMEQFLSEQLDH